MLNIFLNYNGMEVEISSWRKEENSQMCENWTMYLKYRCIEEIRSEIKKSLRPMEMNTQHTTFEMQQK